MPQVIPVTNDASQEFTALGFDFKFEWNTTDQGWRMNISQNGTAIITGLRMVMGIFLLDAYALDIGDFFIINNESESADPDRNAWDGSFSLLYYTEQEKEDAISQAS